MFYRVPSTQLNAVFSLRETAVVSSLDRFSCPAARNAPGVDTV